MKRGRNQRRRPNNNPNRAMDSNGPDVRIRGTANQIYDKYLTLARDAQSAGDRIKAENYLQHAEHYFRQIRATQATQPQQQNQPNPNGDGDQPNVADGEGNDGKAPAPHRNADQGGRNSTGENRNDRSERDDKEQTSSEADAETDAEEAPKKPRRRARRAPKNETADDASEAAKEPQAAE